jgi:hypothetical protein
MRAVASRKMCGSVVPAHHYMKFRSRVPLLCERQPLFTPPVYSNREDPWPSATLQWVRVVLCLIGAPRVHRFNINVVRNTAPWTWWK